MTSPQDRILGSCKDREIRLHVCGHAVAQQCPAILRYVESGLQSGAERILVELNECTYCDSTFVGTLLQLRQTVQDEPTADLKLIAPTSEVAEILCGLGIEELFATETAPPPQSTAAQSDATEWQQLDPYETQRDPVDFSRLVIEAHEKLVRSSPVCRDRYGSVVNQMQHELNERISHLKDRLADTECEFDD